MSWIGEITPYIDFTYCEPPDPNNFMPDCSTMCCSTERRVTSYSGMAIHTAHGKVTLGSKAHDTCVRDLGGPAWLLSLPGMPYFGPLLLGRSTVPFPVLVSNTRGVTSDLMPKDTITTQETAASLSAQ